MCGALVGLGQLWRHLCHRARGQSSDGMLHLQSSYCVASSISELAQRVGAVLLASRQGHDHGNWLAPYVVAGCRCG
jgi:hypothetical protein